MSTIPIDKALALRKKGLTYAQIREVLAKAGLRISATHLYKLMRESGAATVYNVAARKRTLNPRHLEWLKRRQHGESLAEIGECYGVSKQAVYAALKKLVDFAVDAK